MDWLRILRDRVVPRRTKLVPEERLQFETLLSELSAGLIHLAAADVDAAIERGLQRVVTFLGVDRGQLDEYVESKPVVRIAWARPGFEDMPRLVDDEQFPWTAETLRRGQVIRFSRIDELPAAAALDQANLRRAGTRSKICLPLRAGGPMLGVLSFGAVRAERAWPDDLVERLRLLSEAFSNALERKRMELSLAERLRFERLLSSLSVAFSHLSIADFDQEIQHGLRQVVDFLGVDRGSLIEFSRDGTTARSWAIEEWMDVGGFPWMTARLRSGDVVRFAQLEQLPDEAAVDRRSYLSNRVKPQVAIPLQVSGIVVGGLVFGTVGAERARSDELLEQLHLLGEVFANALARKQGELEAQRLRQDLTHIGRVSALGELTASLAHELNQPLAAILSNAQAAERLLAAVAVPEEVREILRDIVTDDRRASDVIRRLRALVKKGDLEFVPLDLNELIREVASLMRSDAISRGISLSLELAADVPTVRGDRVQLQQVVLNLVLNGLDAMHEPGAGERTLVIRTARDGADAVAISVQDAGTGIDEKTVDQLFQPLFTTKTEGLGMGLAIARTIADAHGGRMRAANNVTAGATFQFSLPVSREGAR